MEHSLFIAKLIPRISVTICLLAVIATLSLIMPGEYCRLTTAAESLSVVVIVGPYLFLAMLAWIRRGDPRASRALLTLTALLAIGGLGVFAAETSDYRTQVADFAARDPARGAEYLQARFQRIALFVVPALQWFVALMAVGALLMQSTAKIQTAPILFFDGVCGLCNRSVDWIIRRDRKAIFRFAPLQGEAARERLGIDATADLKSIVLLDDHGEQRQSDAVVSILRRLGGFWRFCGALLWIVPRSIRNWGYDIIVRNRYRWFGKLDTCRMPTPAERARFLP